MPSDTPAAGPVDTVVFDIGGVLLDWNPRHLFRDEFADHERMEWFLANVCTNDWNVRQDAGRPWAEAIAELVSRHPEFEREIRLYRSGWRRMVRSEIAPTVGVLERLRAARVPLYAITNFAADTFEEAVAAYPFLGRFDGVVVSGQIGIIKPDRRIFEHFASTHGVDLGRAVFIDDSAKNVAGARDAGMHALPFTDAEALARDLGALGLRF